MFARRFTEGIGKLAVKTPEDRQKKTGRLTVRMPEVAGLAGWVNRPYPGFGRLSHLGRRGLIFTQKKLVVDAVCLKEDSGVDVGL
ncbi:hypothetical protein GW17_00047795 [Ensete ventricosum]|nr:hypothetical protein GW17_00047795 [Ensete ventricosum]